MGTHTDTYATINDTWEISRKTSYLLRNIDTEIGEFMGMGNHVDDIQMMPPVESELMMSWGSHTK